MKFSRKWMEKNSSETTQAQKDKTHVLSDANASF